MSKPAAPQPPALGGEPEIYPTPGFTAWFNDAGKQGLEHELGVEDLMEGAYAAGHRAHVARLQAEVERQSAERQTYVESTQRACKVIGQLRGLLRSVVKGGYLAFEENDDAMQLEHEILAALAEGKEHD